MALVEREPGNWNYERLEDTGYSMGQLESFFRDLAAKYDVSYEPSDVSEAARKLMGETKFMPGLGDPGAMFAAYERKYYERSAPTSHRGDVDSQSLPATMTYADLSREVGFVAPAQQAASPAPVAVAPSPPLASVVTTLGATQPATATPTVGPVGLAYPDDPINYATGRMGPSQGYSTGDILPSGIYPSGASGGPMPMMTTAAGGDQTMMYVLLAAAAVAVYLVLSKK